MALTLKAVLISDEVAPKCLEILQQNGIKAIKNTKLSKDELLVEIPKYDGLIVRSATTVSADVISAATNLKIIGRAGTGVDNIDTDAATKRGIIVMNTPFGNTLSAAEHTCAMLLAMTRHIAAGTESLHAGRWDRKKFMGNEVMGKTLAIIGLGKIGKEAALRMQAFGMTTIGFDPIVSAEEAAEFNTEWLPVEKLWPRADYITVHTPLIPQTKHLLNDTTFAACKKGVRVINCARGGIIDEDALLRALESGQCGGAALDVFVEEPPTNRALIDHPLVTSTPHLGASTVEAQARVAEEIAQQFVDAVQGKGLFGAINARALTNAMSPDTKPWVELGKALGKLAAVIGGPVSKDAEVKVVTQGAGLQPAGSYLGAAALVGLLSGQSKNGLNLVNAPDLAKDMGVTVKSEHIPEASSFYPKLVTLEVKKGSETVVLAGTVAGERPLLVTLCGEDFSGGVVLQGHLLVYRAPTSPAMIATMAGAVASDKVTVQSFAISTPLNGESWSIMCTSSPVLALNQLPVEFVKQLTL